MRRVGQDPLTRPEDPDPARRRFGPACAILLAALLLAGCVATPTSEPMPAGPPRSLAATPEPLKPEDSPSASPTASPATSPTTSPPTSPSAAPPAFRSRARIVDAKGDAGLQAPAYADLISVVVESDGRDARVTVDVGANLSATLADGEVIGIGVDLYRNADADESDFQLFADGGDDGWFAYLQTPKGFVDFPGSFRLGGGRLVFQVPLQSLGGLTATAATCFLDWSKEGPVVNAAASDKAPDAGRARIDP